MFELKECDIQKTLVEYCATLNVKQYLIYIPNEQVLFSSKNKQKWGWWKKLLKMGYRPGVSDLFLALPTKNFHGVWIELKRIKNGKQTMPSANQVEFLNNMTEKGYRTEIIYTVDSGIALIKAHVEQHLIFIKT